MWHYNKEITTDTYVVKKWHVQVEKVHIKWADITIYACSFYRKDLAVYFRQKYQLPAHSSLLLEWIAAIYEDGKCM